MKSEREKKTFVQTISYNDLLVRDYRLLDVYALPSAALLDMVYRYSKQYLNTTAVALMQVAFMQPVVVSEEADKKVYITFSPQKNHYTLTITSQNVKDNEALQDHFEQNMECMLYSGGDDKQVSPVQEKLREADFDIKEVISRTVPVFDIEKAVVETGVKRGENMKTRGRIYRTGTAQILELSLHPAAEANRQDYCAHPAFLDGMVYAGLTPIEQEQMEGEGQSISYVPVGIERFVLLKDLPRVIYGYVKHRETMAGMVIADLYFYDEEGQLCVLFEGLNLREIVEEEQNNQAVREVLENAKEQILRPANKSPEGLTEQEQLILLYLTREVAYIIDKKVEQINPAESFYDLGLDSVQLINFVKSIEEKIEANLFSKLMIEVSTIRELAAYLAENHSDCFTLPGQTGI